MCGMAVEIAKFLVKGSSQLTVTPDQQEEIKVESRGVSSQSCLLSQAQRDASEQDNILKI